MKNELVATENTPARLLELAVQQNLDVDKLGKLMEMQAEWERRQAKKAFDLAKAEFQHKCPKIKRTKNVEYKATKYSYAPLSEITDTVKDALKDCGFSYRWQNDDQGDAIVVTSHLTHEGGHTESNTMRAVKDDSGAKNVIQQYGSTVTYLQRYTLLGVLGITSADEDDDGRGSGALNIEGMLAHMELVREFWQTLAMIKECLRSKDYDEALRLWGDIPRDAQMGIWRAPSKGGYFDTAELAAIKSARGREDAA